MPTTDPGQIETVYPIITDENLRSSDFKSGVKPPVKCQIAESARSVVAERVARVGVFAYLGGDAAGGSRLCRLGDEIAREMALASCR